ncbi:MAG: hypothetical protein QOD24_1925 [Solirubrobacteraceae bacterium]|nr:hypothetical protein [Solirubrobacteraceae bacterium]
MATTDFLDQKRNEIGGRLKELRPLVDEYERLKAAAAALDGVPATALMSSTTPAGPRARTASRATPSSRKRAPSQRRRGRPKGSGTRGAEALALIKASPGITIPGIAEKMGIKQNYLYRVVPGLAEDGLVIKDGRGWKTKDAA